MHAISFFRKGSTVSTRRSPGTDPSTPGSSVSSGGPTWSLGPSGPLTGSTNPDSTVSGDTPGTGPTGGYFSSRNVYKMKQLTNRFLLNFFSESAVILLCVKLYLPSIY